MFISSPLFTFQNYQVATLLPQKFIGSSVTSNATQLVFTDIYNNIPQVKTKVNILEDLVDVYGWEDNNIYYVNTKDVHYLYLNEDSSNLFDNFPNLQFVNFNDKIRFDKIKNLSEAFKGRNSNTLTLNRRIDISTVENLTSTFENFTGVTDGLITGNSSKVKQFSKCLKSVNLSSNDLSWLDITNAYDTSEMFSSSQINGSIISRIPLKNQRLDNLYNASYMFYNCKWLDIDSIDFTFTQDNIDLSRMFELCNSLYAKISLYFNRYNSTVNLSHMFDNCNCTGIDISGFITCSNFEDFAYNNSYIRYLNIPNVVIDTIHTDYFLSNAYNLERISVDKSFFNRCWSGFGTKTGTNIINKDYGIWFDEKHRPYRTDNAVPLEDTVTLYRKWHYQEGNIVYINCANVIIDADYLATANNDYRLVAGVDNYLTLSTNNIRIDFQE